LKVTTEPLEQRQLRLTIDVGEDRTQKAMRRVARQISRQVNIPGFRKGKAPYELVVQRFGEETVRKEAAEDVVQAVYREAVEQEAIKPYAPGRLEEMELEPLTFTFTIPLPPTIDLGDYRDYRLEARKVEVSKTEIAQALEEIQEQNAILEPVERPAAVDDGATINLVGRTMAGVEFLRQDELRVLLEGGSAEPAPGFVEAVVGMEAGEERTFTLTLSEDFPREELQNQEVEFTVEMLEVYESTLPGLDDDLARTVGNFESLKELEAHVEERLRQAAQRQADEEYTAQVLEALLEEAQVEYPPVMLEEELDGEVKEFEQAVKREARLSLDDYLRFQNKTVEELRDEMRPRAEARLKRALVLGEVVRQEGLEVDEGEISARIEEVSASWGVRADEIRASLGSESGREALRRRLLVDQAVGRLVAIARGEAPELPSPEEHEDEIEAAQEQEDTTVGEGEGL
jgi:trigger factor